MHRRMTVPPTTHNRGATPLHFVAELQELTAYPIAADDLMLEADRALPLTLPRLEIRMAEVWTICDETPPGVERNAAVELAWRLERLADNPYLRSLVSTGSGR